MEQVDLEALCTNCGLCCILKTTGEYCQHVKVMPDKTTRCKIYNHPNRIGLEIAPGLVCMPAMQVRDLWDDCPYNNLKIPIMIEEANKGIVQIIHETLD